MATRPEPLTREWFRSEPEEALSDLDDTLTASGVTPFSSANCATRAAVAVSAGEASFGVEHNSIR